MPYGTSTFQDDWLNPSLNPSFSVWVARSTSSRSWAGCRLCRTEFDISTMGKRALTSHENGKKHKQLFTARTSTTQMRLPGLTPAAAADVPVSTASVASTMDEFVIKKQATRAEVLACLKAVDSHHSFRSLDNFPQLAAAMFPDSEIAKHISLGRTKAGYIIAFGLAPFFSREIVKKMDNCRFVACFDESFNAISHAKQMDIHVRFWDNSINQVSCCFFNSAFMGHSDATRCLEEFKSATSDLKLGNMLQLSMDGPNVNWKMHNLLEEHLGGSRDRPVLLKLGSCGLHVVHNSFVDGHNASGWDLAGFLQAIYYCFKDSAVRKEDFQETTGQKMMPLKFAIHRWCENRNVCERAIELLPHLRQYVEKVDPKPKIQSFTKLERYLEDSMLLPKLRFFSFICGILEPFLRKFQTPKPMVPFLAEELDFVQRQLMRISVKSSVIQAADTQMKLIKVNLDDASKLLPPDKVHLGIATAVALDKSTASDAAKLQFKLACSKFTVAVLKKIMQKSPVVYPIVRCCSCLSPKWINAAYSDETKRASVVQRATKLLKLLLDHGVLKSTEADNALQEFEILLSDKTMQENFKAFKIDKQGLDELFVDVLQRDGNDIFPHLMNVVKTVCVLSHGNATVESGFSVNKEILVENLSERSLVSQRLVCDKIRRSGGALQVELTAELLQSVTKAHSRYKDYRDAEKRQNAALVETAEKRKKMISKLAEVKEKKRKLEAEANAESVALATEQQALEQCIASLT